MEISQHFSTFSDSCATKSLKGTWWSFSGITSTGDPIREVAWTPSSRFETKAALRWCVYGVITRTGCYARKRTIRSTRGSWG